MLQRIFSASRFFYNRKLKIVACVTKARFHSNQECCIQSSIKQQQQKINTNMVVRLDLIEDIFNKQEGYKIECQQTSIEFNL